MFKDSTINGSMGGSSVSPYLTERLCGSDLHDCVSGEIVTGFLSYYSFDGQQGGLSLIQVIQWQPHLASLQTR